MIEVNPYEWANWSEDILQYEHGEVVLGRDVTELAIGFKRPESYVVSMRLNREESRLITRAAEFHGLKLSTWIKRAALAEARKPLIRWTVA